MIDLTKDFVDRYKLLIQKPKENWDDSDKKFNEEIRSNIGLGQLTLLNALADRFRSGDK